MNTKQVPVELSPCPCSGPRPKEPGDLAWDLAAGWLIVSSAVCCGQWYVCAEIDDEADGDECERVSIEAWNEAPRPATPASGECEIRLAEAERLLSRYRKETPLGNQPHMIADEVDEFLRARTKP